MHNTYMEEQDSEIALIPCVASVPVRTRVNRILTEWQRSRSTDRSVCECAFRPRESDANDDRKRLVS